MYNLCKTIDFDKNNNNALVQSICEIKTQIISNKCDEKKEFENRYETFSEIPLISGGFIAHNNNNNSLSTVRHH